METTSDQQYWLLKTEPSTYSIEQFLKDKTTHWDGVANSQAKNYLKKMRPGDTCFIYHSGKDKSVVGMGFIKQSGDIPVIYKPSVFLSPVHLHRFKSEPKYKDFALVKQSRLSVMPVPEDIADFIARNSQ